MDEDKVRSRMQEVLNMVLADVASIRTGRAAPSLVEEIVVSAYGGQQQLKVNELANITASDNRTLIIRPWDKTIIGEIKKAIDLANIGLNPVIDQDIIRIFLPPLTTEDREKYVKLLSTKLENGKIMIRQVRGDAMRDIREAFENKELSEDEKFNEEKRLQEITDDFVKKIDEAGERKEKELMAI
jgi:ribosome recycling factor